MSVALNRIFNKFPHMILYWIQLKQENEKSGK